MIRSRGARWNAARPLEEQDGWPAHASLMNALRAEAFVLLGGPLEGTSDVLLIVRADGPEQIEARLAADNRSRDGMLTISLIAPWQLRLGSLPLVP